MWRAGAIDCFGESGRTHGDRRADCAVVLAGQAMSRLRYCVRIDAPRATVWNTMLGEASYRSWRRSFCAGSYYEGSWAEGARIHFLSPEGGGMTALIAANRPFAHVSIKPLGILEKGVEDTTSERVRRWAPAFENYTLRHLGGRPELEIELEVASDLEHYMNDTWPQALAALKALCEGGEPAGP